jgi:hypothetical protein
MRRNLSKRRCSSLLPRFCRRAESEQAALTSSFVAAVVLNAAIFGTKIVAVTVLRRSFPAVYEPRARFCPRSEFGYSFVDYSQLTRNRAWYKTILFLTHVNNMAFKSR